jgi:hypothetical protein
MLDTSLRVKRGKATTIVDLNRHFIHYTQMEAKTSESGEHGFYINNAEGMSHRLLTSQWYEVTFGLPCLGTEGDTFCPYVCAACGQDATLLAEKMQRCDKCLGTYYCGRVCQKRDWQAGHKLTCVAYTADE